ncbi:MAG: lipid-A-disaccharide synthase [Ignavibacteria bacterium]
MSKRIFIVAGEMSGDTHGALLIEQLRMLMPDCIIDGIGGPAMEAQGLRSIVEFSQMNISGFLEVIKSYPTLFSVLRYAKKTLKEGKYDVFIAVDYPGFNMRLGTYARSLGILSMCYIAPQLWAWGESRIQQVIESYDTILTVLPFEQAFFAKHGIHAPFIGHPLLDRSYMKEVSTQRDSNIICLMPGSRMQEIKHHLPILEPLAKELQNISYEPVYCIPKHLHHKVQSVLQSNSRISHDTPHIMNIAKAGIVKMGTSTLEAALLQMPFIGYYSTSWISYQISRSKITLPWISLPNILLERNLIPEFIQQNTNPTALMVGMKELLSGPAISQQLHGFDEIRQLLGGPGASRRAAMMILNTMEGR